MRRSLTRLILFIAATASAGIAYRFEGTSAAGHVVAEGKSMRIEFDRGDGMLFKEHTVVLTTDGGRTLTVLDPATKTFATMRLDDLFGAMTVSSSKVSARDLGSGGTIEGYPTRKWSLDASYDLILAGAPARVHMTLHSDSWRTDRIPEEQQFKLRQGDPLAKLMPPQVKGFALKEVTTIRTGSSTTVTSTTAVHDVRTVKTAPAQFAVPAGYRPAR